MSLRGTFNNGRSSAPIMYYEISYSQTGRTGTNATYSVKVRPYLKSGHWYAYNINGTININGTTQTKQLWSTSGSGTTQTFSITASAGTGGGTLSASFSAAGSGDSDCNISVSGKTVSLTTWNTAPTISGAPTISPGGTIPENTANISITSPAASDKEGGILTYRIRVSINGGGYTEIYRGTGRSYNHDISGYGEGTSFKYICNAHDSYGAWSNDSGTTTATKNVMTNGGFTSHSNDLSFDTGSVTMNFNRGSNSNGSTIYMMCYSDNVTIANQTELTTGTSQIITIYKSGTVPTGPYIKFNDLKAYFKSSSYSGRLHIGLRTRNGNGNYKTSSGSIGVDLRTNPDIPTSVTINGGTAYKTVASTGSKYYIPDGSSTISISWVGGGDKLGGGWKYRLFQILNGNVTQVAETTSGIKAYNLVIPKLSATATLSFRVQVITDYNYSSNRDSAAVNLHYYNSPGLTTGTITRGATTADIKVTIKSNSSIPNINTVGTWKNYTKGTVTPVLSSGTLTISQLEQILKVTSLTDTGQYDLKVTFKDSTGFVSDTTANISIGQNSPILFINKYGAGINGVKADSKYALKVKNGAMVNGYLGQCVGTIGTGANLNNYLTEGEYSVGGDNIANAPTSGSLYGKLIIKVNDGGTHNNNSNWIWQTMYMSSDSVIYRRNKINANAWNAWSKDYNSRSKPNPGDIGAATASHTHTNYMVKDAINTGWYRSTGATGWFNSGFGGGIYMSDNVWVRTYGSKSFYCDKVIKARDGIELADLNAFQAFDLYRSGSRARYGIGSDSSTVNYACIETWNSGATGYASRFDLKPTVCQITTGSAWYKMWTNVSGHGGISIGDGSAAYFKWLRSAPYIQCRNYADNAFATLEASTFRVNSQSEVKEGLGLVDSNTIKDIVNNNNIYSYQLKPEIEYLNTADEEALLKGYVLEDEQVVADTKVGLVIDKLTPEAYSILRGNRGECLDLYSMTSMLWKYSQDLQKQIYELNDKIEGLQSQK